MAVACGRVKLAERHFWEADERKALVSGAGTISEQVVRANLRDRGIAQLHVMNSRGMPCGGIWPNSSANKRVSAGVDGYLAGQCTGCGGVVVHARRGGSASARFVERAMWPARRKPRIVLMDAGRPRNIDPASASSQRHF